MTSPGSADPSHLVDRASRSPWVAGETGLAEAVKDWDHDAGDERRHLSDTAIEITRPGAVSPVRVVRHLTAAGLSRVIRTPTRLPNDLRELRFLREPDLWARQAGAEAFADQLALGGAATAELARMILTARRLFPSDIVDELQGRTIGPPDIERERAQEIAQLAFGERIAIGERPVASLPISQLNTGRTTDGRRVLVRVRRPGVARQIRADARLSGNMMLPLQQLLPQMGGMAPLGFAQLTTRQGLEAIDLRFEALNLVEFGLIAEEAGIDGLQVARPLPGGVDERALLLESVDGVSLAKGTARPDPEAALRSLITLTLEPALVHGVFWADPAPEHLLVTRDGGLVLAGIGAAGRLSPQLRKAGIRFLTSVMSGDAEGQVEAMRLAGAVDPDTDLDSLVDDLRAADTLQVSQILMGGEAGLLNGLRDATRILLAHRLTPPLDVVMLLRTVFALGELTEQVAPDSGGLMAALLPLLQQLPELIAAAHADDDD